MEDILIEVGMSEAKMASVPARLIARALGSCVGIVLYDPLKKIGGMIHAMLPDIANARFKSNPDRFVNSAIRKMVEELEKKGSVRRYLWAKLFGGAQMFNFITSDTVLNIGEKNIEMAREVLSELGIRILAEEVGGTFGRTITLNLDNGKVLVSTVSWGEKEV